MDGLLRTEKRPSNPEDDNKVQGPYRNSALQWRAFRPEPVGKGSFWPAGCAEGVAAGFNGNLKARRPSSKVDGAKLAETAEFKDGLH